jgi:lipid-A-disaccharide synthase
MKYFIVSGEPSGDLHGSTLAKEIYKMDNEAIIYGWGGDLMKNAGVNITKHFTELAFMGFVEVLLNLNKILKNFREFKNTITNLQPDKVILIDFPGFNLRIAKWLHKNNFKTYYYILPQIWAWNRSRAKKIKKYIDHSISILPFEEKFYKKYNLKVHYVGHPLLDHIQQFKLMNKDVIKTNKPIIAILPGSRIQEIKKLLPEMVKAVKPYENDFQIYVAGLSFINKNIYLDCGVAPDQLLINETYNLLQSSYAAVVTSGTATLETAIFDVPLVVCYKANWVSYLIARMVARVRFISLVNLIYNEQIVKELIQEKCTADNINYELNRIISDKKYRQKMIENFAELKKILGDSGASQKAAEIVVKY